MSSLAPYLTVLVLVVLISTGGVESHQHKDLEAYMANVREAIEQIPLRVGSSVGADVEPTQAAVRILSPNKILQRRYLDPLTGASLSLLIVHCGDMRDMLGHYPPVCYPAHGWQSGSRRTVPVTVGNRQAIAMLYEFKRLEELNERRMTVVNFFILPGDSAQFASDMTAVERIARSRVAAGLGVAQVQVVLDGTPAADEVNRNLAEILPVLEPVARAIGRGVEQ